MAPRSMASQSLISSTRWLRPPFDGMKIMLASVTRARFWASWPAAEYICWVARPRSRAADSMAAWTRGAQMAGVVAAISATGSADVPRPEAYDAMRVWERTLFDAGYIGLTWPKEYGGRGLTFLEEMILHQEMALAKAPPVLNILGGAQDPRTGGRGRGEGNLGHAQPRMSRGTRPRGSPDRRRSARTPRAHPPSRATSKARSSIASTSVR